MTSSTPTRRRVLSDLDVNTPSSGGALQLSKLRPASPSKPCKVGEVLLQTEVIRVSGAEYEEAAMGSKKRDGGILDERVFDEYGSHHKRPKTVRSSKVGGKDYVRKTNLGQSFDGCNDDEDVPRSPPARQNVRSYDQNSSSAFASPASSFASHQLDDSQNTLITEPDDAALPPPTISFTAPPRPALRLMTKEEAREKAEVLRLRLQLASYKVRTNQINVPLDRLEIKTVSSTEPKLPCIPRTIRQSTARNASQPRQPLSSTTTKGRARADSIPSSPPPYLPINKRQSNPASPEKESRVNSTEGDDNNEGITTPLLPRQRQDLANPPALGSPVWNDLTSSVVKGRAAVGLLSLKRQN